MEYILGLDISTSEAGICVINKETEQIELMKSLSFNVILGIKKQKGSKTTVPYLIAKVDIFAKEITELINKYNITDIFIEDFLLSFSGGATNKKTLIGLSQFNGMCQCVLSREFKQIPVTMIHVATARKLLMGKAPSGANQKGQVAEWVLANVDYEVPIADNTEDMIDAYVIAVGGKRNGSTGK